MPRYDFRCEPCDDTFEVSRPSSDRSPVPCPACGEEAKRVFSPVGVVFKGSGFHNTDYRTSDASPEPAPAASSSETSTCGDSSSCAGCPAAASD